MEKKTTLQEQLKTVDALIKEHGSQLILLRIQLLLLNQLNDKRAVEIEKEYQVAPHLFVSGFTRSPDFPVLNVFLLLFPVWEPSAIGPYSLLIINHSKNQHKS